MLHYKNCRNIVTTTCPLDQNVLFKGVFQILVPLVLFSFMVISGFGQSKKTVGAFNVSKSQNIIYPVNANAVIDVTKPPYNVDNTGKKDCTKELNRAYSDVMEVILKAYKKSIIDLAKMSDEEYNKRYHENKRDKVIFPEEMNKASILYFPNGIYKVSNTIVYTQDLRNVQGQEMSRQIHFQGQSQAGVIIRLADNAPGFQKGADKPVINFNKGDKSNVAMSNTFENITIDIGSGNPGAIGLSFHASNSGAVRNVTIRSNDPQKVGSIGLAMLKGGPHGIFKNIDISGFDFGIRTNDFDGNVVFEHIKLEGQKKAGFKIIHTPSSIRKLTSKNTVPAIEITGSQALVVLLDSDLSGGNTSNPAIDVQAGHLFARNVSTSGYGVAVQKAGIPVIKENKINEYSSSGSYNVFEGPKKSLSLAIEETPEVPWEQDMKKWVSVNEFGAKGDGIADDTKAIQKAMNSGKPVIYFNQGSYLIDASITVPASVKRINFMNANLESGSTLNKMIDKGAFVINENSSDPLIMEDLLAWEEFRGDHYLIDHASTRTLVLSDLHLQAGAMYRNSVQGAKVFIENVVSVDGGHDYRGNCFTFTGQKVWARQIDPERASPQILNDHSTLWVLGSKTEAAGVSFETRNGGKTEALGGYVYNGSPVIDDNLPIIINHESRATHVMTTSGRSDDGHYFKVMARETKNGVTKELLWKDVPRRFEKQSVIPLYIGYK